LSAGNAALQQQTGYDDRYERSHGPDWVDVQGFPMLTFPKMGPLDGANGSPLSDLVGFGSNPGNLRARTFVPEKLAEPAALVVVLHGCTQTAAAYDHGAGWSDLAARHGFALLFPEQQRANNSNLCFNWFRPSDTARDSGEAASIRQMIDRMCEDHPIDPSRIFITGLSAGGAMTSAMLATYPELFAGGAIIAGIAYGCAGTVGEAFECMGGRTSSPATVLGDNVRLASPHAGPWPRVSVWHGSNDATVTASNGDDIVKQWLNVHGLRAKPHVVETVDGYPHRAWQGKDGTPLVEQYVITGMGHGTPLAPGDSAGQSGAAGPHMLDVAISSTDRIAASWGLTEGILAEKARPKGARRPKPAPQAKENASPASALQSVIEDALRAGGLIR
jgi:poly(hydroxyalkanoate) depolymerase family esterase